MQFPSEKLKQREKKKKENRKTLQYKLFAMYRLNRQVQKYIVKFLTKVTSWSPVETREWREQPFVALFTPMPDARKRVESKRNGAFRETMKRRASNVSFYLFTVLFIECHGVLFVLETRTSKPPSSTRGSLDSPVLSARLCFFFVGHHGTKLIDRANC